MVTFLRIRLDYFRESQSSVVKTKPCTIFRIFSILQCQCITVSVPRRVLKDQYEGVLEPDEKNYNPNEGFDEFDNYDAENEHIRESAASPPISKLDKASKDNLTKNAEDTASQDKSHALGFGKF